MVKKNIIKMVGILLILFSALYLIIIYYKELSVKNKNNILLKSFFKEYNNDGNKVERQISNYFMVIEIPKINLKQGFFKIDDKRNNIDENIMILNGSRLTDDEVNLLILVSHSGSASNAYFKDIYKLTFNDEVFIYYNNKKLVYEVSRVYTKYKQDVFSINESDYNKLILITCLNKEKYLITECIPIY